ncbi:unnamed protein product [Kuraishia capsulata CBS 1993]|uniref:Very-long-chain (3R)-3-hydroxyacyl-CoA dehydratase n=1 Tax=Kuraishia capsulata CBS 1993 TaxID=1382522 RepID=W6MRH2_9ASCO|nr:uncharacterized protein KUCA_T00005297001 [Kuraishia capsulata CBS 1993]CDK29309.1 unnamed protein product [Kuraishia capsulata CBS 1993]
MSRIFPRHSNLQKYLLLTNGLSAFLWLAVLMRLLVLFPLVGTRFLPGGIADFFLAMQFLIVIELANYFVIFRKPNVRTRTPSLVNLALGTFTRAIVSYGTIWKYPRVARNNAFALLIASESISETIRYAYVVYKVRTFGLVSTPIRYLKSFSTMIMFPVRVLCEMALLFVALPYADHDNPTFASFLRILLLLYVPTLYVVYSSTFRSGRSSHQKES